MDSLHPSPFLCLTVCASEPQSGPKMSVLVHEARQIRIQWDELPVDQQRGFITNYTIYLQTLDSSSPELKGELLHCVLLCVCVLYMWMQLKQWIDSSITRWIRSYLIIDSLFECFSSKNDKHSLVPGFQFARMICFSLCYVIENWIFWGFGL